jgi:hypothetical protein
MPTEIPDELQVEYSKLSSYEYIGRMVSEVDDKLDFKQELYKKIEESNERLSNINDQSIDSISIQETLKEDFTQEQFKRLAINKILNENDFNTKDGKKTINTTQFMFKELVKGFNKEVSTMGVENFFLKINEAKEKILSEINTELKKESSKDKETFESIKSDKNKYNGGFIPLSGYN